MWQRRRGIGMDGVTSTVTRRPAPSPNGIGQSGPDAQRHLTRGRGRRTKVTSALMDVSGGGEVAVLHPSALGGFCHIQLDSSLPFSFSLSFPIWSSRKLAVRWINMLSGAQIQNLLLLGAPCLHRSMSYVLHQVVVLGWGGSPGSQTDI